jgi:hypothetical protein
VGLATQSIRIRRRHRDLTTIGLLPPLMVRQTGGKATEDNGPEGLSSAVQRERISTPRPDLTAAALVPDPFD